MGSPAVGANKANEVLTSVQSEVQNLFNQKLDAKGVATAVHHLEVIADRGDNASVSRDPKTGATQLNIHESGKQLAQLEFRNSKRGKVEITWRNDSNGNGKIDSKDESKTTIRSLKEMGRVPDLDRDTFETFRMQAVYNKEKIERNQKEYQAYEARQQGYDRDHAELTSFQSRYFAIGSGAFNERVERKWLKAVEKGNVDKARSLLSKEPDIRSFASDYNKIRDKNPDALPPVGRVGIKRAYEAFNAYYSDRNKQYQKDQDNRRPYYDHYNKTHREAVAAYQKSVQDGKIQKDFPLDAFAADLPALKAK